MKWVAKAHLCWGSPEPILDAPWAWRAGPVAMHILFKLPVFNEKQHWACWLIRRCLNTTWNPDATCGFSLVEHCACGDFAQQFLMLGYKPWRGKRGGCVWAGDLGSLMCSLSCGFLGKTGDFCEELQSSWWSSGLPQFWCLWGALWWLGQGTWPLSCSRSAHTSLLVKRMCYVFTSLELNHGQFCFTLLLCGVCPDVLQNGSY